MTLAQTNEMLRRLQALERAQHATTEVLEILAAALVNPASGAGAGSHDMTTALSGLRAETDNLGAEQ